MTMLRTNQHIGRAGRLAFLLTATLACTACGGGGGEPAQDHAAHDHDHDEHGHHHVAPHGGTLVVLGDEFAHIELLLDPKTGKLQMYSLGAHAEQGVPLDHGQLTLSITTPATSFDLLLEGVASQLTGETRGHTSVFSGTSDKLIGVAEFEGKLPLLRIRGTDFKDVSFNFPEGNE